MGDFPQGPFRRIAAALAEFRRLEPPEPDTRFHAAQIKGVPVDDPGDLAFMDFSRGFLGCEAMLRGARRPGDEDGERQQAKSFEESVRRRDHANFAPNSRERIAKSPKNFGAPRAQKLRELGQRGCANRRTSLQLFSESACVRMQDNARVQRRDDANFAQKSREKFAKFPEIRHAPRTKNACIRAA